eukprot:CAMPEP_0115869420 /NCGR_PEP_ID=MMETSP0287-20121206/21801_1 /TAXON_ID=412157 /ORGANISM="Chrysochromulina rotalis, Strain UIO044" /LENGTH=83 /DNA_ID=CAMNT_0003324109 /DNA_START=462 /DNA_END=715 /DNA_ORIENTATION=+
MRAAFAQCQELLAATCSCKMLGQGSKVVQVVLDGWMSVMPELKHSPDAPSGAAIKPPLGQHASPTSHANERLQRDALEYDQHL